MTEQVRLVIWDLDETFWFGTLTEGGMTINPETIAIVKTLAERGIMSSICSKNTFDTVKDILVEWGIWDYFIFPSINWDPKGRRIASLIEDVQLRAPTVMFIDDNPMNLNEALHFTPDLQVKEEDFIPEILNSPLFKGKDDSNLSRLAQYKMLETKKVDMHKVAGDEESGNIEFLRLSNIVAHINNDIESEIDRAVELINRTNQLNFTKKRLPENPEKAHEELRQLLSNPDIEAGIVQVVDRYGDYGQVGFYAHNQLENSLVHFCFSCRTLNMGVENWLYQRLGEPKLEVIGEVLTDLFAAQYTVDWIREASEIAAEEAGDDAESSVVIGDDWRRGLKAVEGKEQLVKFNHIVLRGGCEQRSLEHYLSPFAINQSGEFNFMRHDIVFRVDHSLMLRYIMDGTVERHRELFDKLAFTEEDLHSDLFDENGNNNLAILSFWSDARMRLIRHKATDLLMPYFWVSKESNKFQENADPQALLVAETIATEYERAGYIPVELYQDTIRMLCQRIPQNYIKVFMLASTTAPNKDGTFSEVERVAEYNAAALEVLKDFPEVYVFQVSDFMQSPAEQRDATHFSRPVYFRLVKAIMERAAQNKAFIPARKTVTV